VAPARQSRELKDPRALGRLGDPGAIPPLIDASEQAQGEAEVAIFEALAKLKATEAVPAARQAMEQAVRTLSLQ